MNALNIPDTSTPVLILNCGIGALAIMRTLGRQGIDVYGVDRRRTPALTSRYCKRSFFKTYDPDSADDYLDFVIEIGETIGSKCVLIPTSDSLSEFVADYGEQLGETFLFPKNDPELISGLSNKESMYELVTKHGIPTAITNFPKRESDIVKLKSELKFPIMLKGIRGDRLQAKTGIKMLIVSTYEELIKQFRILNDPEEPNLMLQEYIPGGDDEVYIFNGYFNDKSECLSAFTGHKIRQFPIHTGCASLGECRWNQNVADLTIKSMQAFGYKGILDIGYRLDPRDGLYKVLDINPRVGQAFRLFTAENDMDVVQSLYLDLTNQPAPEIRPREGRRWLIEDFDVIATAYYIRERSISFGDWLRSFRGVQETAWFNWRDPVPFVMMLASFIKQTILWTLNQLDSSKKDRHNDQLAT